MRFGKRVYALAMKGSVKATLMGLGCIVTYRYFIKPITWNEGKKSISAIQDQSILSLDSTAALEILGNSLSLVLFVHDDFPPDQISSAVQLFSSTIQLLKAQNKLPPNLKVFIVDKESDVASSKALVMRLGIVNRTPFVLLLDHFLTTEKKYFMPISNSNGLFSSEDLVSFLSLFQSKKLKPTLLGQDRPVDDKNPLFPDIFEVVTDSFDELVLDPSSDVFLEGYTSKCDACKAFAPRIRMLAKLCAEHYPTLRIAQMNVLDNDRPIEHLPEKWTPSIRIFPKCSSLPCDKKGILLSYADLVPSKNASATIHLPTIPELLEFIQKNTNQRVNITPRILSQANQMEEEARIIEKCYQQVLEYMELWQIFQNMISEGVISSMKVSNKSIDKDSSGKSLTILEEESAKVANQQLRNKIVDVYKHIQENASVGTADSILERMESLAEFVEDSGIAATLSIATKEFEKEV
jgi:thiol-disulfide isomerase/thioredoxin